MSKKLKVMSDENLNQQQLMTFYSSLITFYFSLSTHHCLADSSESSVSFLVVNDGGKKIRKTKIGPENISDVNFCVRELPQ